MKKTFLTLVPIAIGMGIILASCGGSTESTTEGSGSADEGTTEQTSDAGAIDTPDNAANTFCDKMKEMEAAAEADKEKMEQELNDLENKIEAEHDGDDAWFEEFETKLEAICPEA